MSTDAVKQSGFAASVTAHLRRRSRLLPGLRMTAMIDVVFLLLTFFVLTAQFEKPEQALPLIFKTDAAAAPALPVKSLELSIAPDAQGCVVTLGATETIVIAQNDPAQGLAALAEGVRAAVAAEQGRPMPIRLHCDDAVLWDLVTKIYDVLYGLGARDITFVVQE